MSIIGTLSSKSLIYNFYYKDELLNMDCADAAIQTLKTHAESIYKTIIALKEVNEPDAATCLFAVKIAHAKIVEKQKTIEKRIFQLNGSYYQDPNCLLHIVFLESRCSTTKQLQFQQLLSERNTLEQELKKIPQQLILTKKIQSFLKIRKIEMKIRTLCGDYYEDPNSELDRAWKAYVQGTGSKEDYDNLEKRKTSLLANRENLQLLYPNEESSNLKQALPQILISLQAEHQKVLKATLLIQELKNWYVTQEHSEATKKACIRVLDCYVTQTPLDINGEQLTSIPKTICEMLSHQ